MSASRLPNLKLLTIFATVARCQGYSRAQQELNMTTPAISGYMSELEQRLGFVLCQRGRGGFSLTPRGEQFLQYSLQLLGTLADFDRQVEGLKSEQGGVFSLGVVDSLSTDRRLGLAESINQFSERFPAVYLNLSVRDPNELQQQVLDNRLDLAIGHFPVNVNNLVTLPLHHEQHWLYCSDSHQLFNRAEQDMGDLHRYGFVTRSYWNQAELARRGFKASAASVESIEAQLILILSGKYIGYLPEHCAQPWVEQGQLKRLLPQQFSYQAPFSLIFRRGRSREMLIRAFRDLVKVRVAAEQ
ncbi:LysR family transcriptional regulator [Erwiniaceae bacterium BAC15a-03b]|uniref:LysR family transcriptional regulator n=1 Tax=Winslowiella arboricola TaxID=2978220 RepID=A0A9J6PP29_9GAMM|nr:LysR family transcriptional regulator [Winslowiella arboricola]MCU5771631.1 LysR family transcriptional regulator [Winslowiella arboricola]MCU5776444.1 LysR family transcriptional regulator [Winslowiella arboricola]